MRKHTLFGSLLCAASVLMFSGIASAQPAPPPPGPAARCDCVGRPNCACDDHHPGAPAPAPQAAPAPHPAPAPHAAPAPHPAPAPHAAPAPHSGHHQTLRPANPSRPAPAYSHPAGDPGMAPDSFNKLLMNIDHQAFSNDKISIIRSAASANRFSCNQVKIIMQRLDFEAARIDAAVILYSRVVDRENWSHIYGAFELASSRASLNRRLGIH